MSEALSQRRMAENEAVFREYNERVTTALELLKEAAQEEGHHELVDEVDNELSFYCECADELCRYRVKLKPSRYEEVHQNRARFVISCGHDIESIERVVLVTPEFCVVEKFETPPEAPRLLNKTDISR